MSVFMIVSVLLPCLRASVSVRDHLLLGTADDQHTQVAHDKDNVIKTAITHTISPHAETTIPTVVIKSNGQG
jgi:hypothetical protein